MQTSTGKRTVHVRVQVVEDSERRITVLFNGEPQPLAFTPDERRQLNALRAATADPGTQSEQGVEEPLPRME